MTTDAMGIHSRPTPVLAAVPAAVWARSRASIGSGVCGWESYAAPARADSTRRATTGTRSARQSGAGRPKADANAAVSISTRAGRAAGVG